MRGMIAAMRDDSRDEGNTRDEGRKGTLLLGLGYICVENYLVQAIYMKGKGEDSAN